MPKVEGPGGPLPTLPPDVQPTAKPQAPKTPSPGPLADVFESGKKLLGDLFPTAGVPKFVGPAGTPPAGTGSLIGGPSPELLKRNDNQKTPKPEIKELQQAINQWRAGLTPPQKPIKDDGFYGSRTEKAVQEFQKANGLLDPKTHRPDG